MSTNKDRADFRCGAYKTGLRALKLVEDVYDGTLRIRDCAKEYLPQNPAEEHDEYRARLARSVFPPFFRRALGKLVGLVFCNEPSLKDVGDEFEEHWKNLDLAGSAGEVFLQNGFEQGAKDGFALIYVDAPPAVTVSASGAPEPTLQDEADADLRPFWRLYKRGQLINWRLANVGGKVVLTLAVLKECTMEPDGEFGEREVVRYRVLRPGSWQLYRAEGRRAPEIEVIEGQRQEGDTGLDYIPLFPTAPLDSDPVLEDLAHMNVQLYQKQSDLDNVLHVANVPVMWARDRNLNVPFIAVGPTVLIDLKGEHSEIGFAEHEGKAIAAAQADIKNLKGDMTVAAMEVLAEMDTPGPKTATGEIIDTAESNSELSLLVKHFQAAVANAKRAHFELMGTEDKGTVELNVEYQRLVLSTDDFRLLKELASENMLTIETLLELMKRAGKLGKEFDVAEEIKKLFGPEGEPTGAERDVMNDDPARTGDPADPAQKQPPADKSKKPAPAPAK